MRGKVVGARRSSCQSVGIVTVRQKLAQTWHDDRIRWNGESNSITLNENENENANARTQQPLIRAYLIALPVLPICLFAYDCQVTTN